MQSKVPPLCYLPSLSFMRFSLEALYVNEVLMASQVVLAVDDDLG